MCQGNKLGNGMAVVGYNHTLSTGGFAHVMTGSSVKFTHGNFDGRTHGKIVTRVSHFVKFSPLQTAHTLAPLHLSFWRSTR